MIFLLARGGTIGYCYATNPLVGEGAPLVSFSDPLALGPPLFPHRHTLMNLYCYYEEKLYRVINSKR